MPYQFLDAYSSVLTADSSVISGVIQRPVVNIGSVLSALPVSISGNSSVSGTVGASVIGTVPVTQSGSWTQSVVGTIGASVIGTVPVVQSGAWAVSVIGIASVSGQVGASIVGTVPVTQSGTQISSISGTVIVGSIVGTYADNSAHAQGSSGIFNLSIRNDTISSITSSNGTYSPNAVGAAGEMIVANAPLTSWVQGVASVFTGVIQPVIAAQGSSVFTYVTGVQVATASATNVYLTRYGATGSVVGYTVAPANGGSNIVLPNALKTNANGAFSASVSGVASVLIAAQGFTSKT